MPRRGSLEVVRSYDLACRLHERNRRLSETQRQNGQIDNATINTNRNSNSDLEATIMSGGSKSVLIIFAFPILIVSLALAIYATTQARKLWLPVPDLSLALSILLPLLTFISFLLPDSPVSPRPSITQSVAQAPRRSSSANARSSGWGSGNFAWIYSLLPSASTAHSLVTLFAVVLLTLTASDLARESVPGCLLQDRWSDLWLARNADAIRGMQDALSCCGFQAPENQAWPFPGRGVPNTACIDRYTDDPRRNAGCREGLVERLRNVDGALTGSAVAVLLAQALVIYFARMSRENAIRRAAYGSGRHAALTDARIVEEDEDAEAQALTTGTGQQTRYMDNPTEEPDGQQQRQQQSTSNEPTTQDEQPRDNSGRS